MRRRCPLRAPVLVLAVSSCALSAQERTFEETVPFEAGGSLSLDTTSGSVRLTSWDRPTVEIQARIEPSPRNTWVGVDADDARRAVNATTIEVERRDRSVRIRTDFPGGPLQRLFDGWRRRVFKLRIYPRVHYEIRAPRQLDLDLDIDRGDTMVRGFEGRLVIGVRGADLDAADLTGDITIDHQFGALDVSRLTGQLSIDLARGQRVVLNTLRGSLRLDLHRTNAVVRDVRIDDHSHVSVHRGDLDIQLDASQPLTIEAEMSRADLSSDLPVTMQRTGRTFHSTINGGGPTLRIKAERSDIRLQTN